MKHLKHPKKGYYAYEENGKPVYSFNIAHAHIFENDQEAEKKLRELPNCYLIEI